MPVRPKSHGGGCFGLSASIADVMMRRQRTDEQASIMSKDPKGLSRRELLSFWRKPLESAVKTINPPAPPAAPKHRPPPLRPPGMLHELLLAKHCIRCGKCVEACPADAIFPLG